MFHLFSVISQQVTGRIDEVSEAKSVLINYYVNKNLDCCENATLRMSFGDLYVYS